MNEPQLTLKEFLETVPLLDLREVKATLKRAANAGTVTLTIPPIRLYCPNPACAGMRNFDCYSKTYDIPWATNGKYHEETFFTYHCRDCRRTIKSFAVNLMGELSDTTATTITKIGEDPRFGEPRPNIVADVLDDEVKFLDRGFRAESEGLGIGAFAYYRRYVESHKDKIFAEIRKVAVAQDLGADLLAKIDKAIASRAFSPAVEAMQDAIPDSLRIKGENPLTLLHNALSEQLHNAEDDKECLEMAQDIRAVLAGLTEKTSQALKSTATLNESVTRLRARVDEKKRPRN